MKPHAAENLILLQSNLARHEADFPDYNPNSARTR